MKEERRSIMHSVYYVLVIAERCRTFLYENNITEGALPCFRYTKKFITDGVVYVIESTVFIAFSIERLVT